MNWTSIAPKSNIYDGELFSFNEWLRTDKANIVIEQEYETQKWCIHHPRHQFVTMERE